MQCYIYEPSKIFATAKSKPFQFQFIHAAISNIRHLIFERKWRRSVNFIFDTFTFFIAKCCLSFILSLLNALFNPIYQKNNLHSYTASTNNQCNFIVLIFQTHNKTYYRTYWYDNVIKIFFSHISFLFNELACEKREFFHTPIYINITYLIFFIRFRTQCYSQGTAK